MAEAESAIKAMLESSASGLSSSSAVYAVLAPQESIKPYAVFDVEDETTTEVMAQQTTPTRCSFTVRIMADSFDEIVTAYRAIKDGLQRFSGTAGGVVVQSVFYESRSDDFDEGEREYEREIDFTLYYEE